MTDTAASFFVGDSVDGGDEGFAGAVGLDYRSEKQEFGCVDPAVVGQRHAGQRRAAQPGAGCTEQRGLGAGQRDGADGPSVAPGSRRRGSDSILRGVLMPVD